MALSIPDYPDPHDAPGQAIPAAYGWIAELMISYAESRANLAFWVNRSADAAATWPDGGSGPRIPPVNRLRISCGDPVPEYAGVTFPSLESVMARAATLAGEMMADAEADSPEAVTAALAAIATGGAIRAAIYSYLIELVFPDAVEVE